MKEHERLKKIFGDYNNTPRSLEEMHQKGREKLWFPYNRMIAISHGYFEAIYDIEGFYIQIPRWKKFSRTWRESHEVKNK